MQNLFREAGFDTVVVVATGFALVSYMLGLFLDPIPAVGVGVLLVAAGTVAFVPRVAWLPAGVSGLVALLIAGVLIPRYVVEFTTISQKMTVTLGLGALVLLSAFAVVRVTAGGKEERGGHENGPQSPEESEPSICRRCKNPLHDACAVE